MPGSKPRLRRKGPNRRADLSSRAGSLATPRPAPAINRVADDP